MINKHKTILELDKLSMIRATCNCKIVIDCCMAWVQCPQQVNTPNFMVDHSKIRDLITKATGDPGDDFILIIVNWLFKFGFKHDSSVLFGIYCVTVALKLWAELQQTLPRYQDAAAQFPVKSLFQPQVQKETSPFWVWALVFFWCFSRLDTDHNPKWSIIQS